MKLEIDNPVYTWIEKKNIDIGQLAKKAINIVGLEENRVNIVLSPSWPEEVSSSEMGDTFQILIAPTFFNANSVEEINKQLLYYLSHELMHTQVKTKSVGNWYRFDLLGDANHLNFSKDDQESIEDSLDMLLDDLMDDRRLFDTCNPHIIEGFMGLHTTGFLMDRESLGWQNNKKRYNPRASTEDLGTLTLRVERRVPLLKHLKDQDKLRRLGNGERLIKGEYNRIVNDMIMQRDAGLRPLVSKNKSEQMDKFHKILCNAVDEGKKPSLRPLLSLFNEILS